MELGDVGLQRDTSQPAKQAQREVAHGRGHVAQHHPQGDGDPGGVGVHTVVLALWQQVDEVIPCGKKRKGHCKQTQFVEDMTVGTVLS